MKYKIGLMIATIFLTAFVSGEKSPEANARYDIAIYGGSSAGVMAAYSAKKLGKSVVLIVPDGHIGGLSSGGLGQTDIGNKHVITGLSRDFYRKLGKQYGQLESWHFEPKKASEVFDGYLKEGNIPIIKDKRIKKVNKLGTDIQSVELVNTYGQEGKVQNVAAKVFIDATYEGDLLALAGVSYTVGREANSVYNETLNGYFLPEYRKQSGYHQFPDGISPYKNPNDPASGLLYGVSGEKPGSRGEGDGKSQAYNFRICLTDSVENQIPIEKPAGYDPEKYELLVRLIEAQPTLRGINDYFIWSRMPNRKTDINNRGGFSTDMIGANYDWSEASFEERKQIFDDHLSYTKGLLYFMKTDHRVPDTLRNVVAKWGYPKDEYIDNEHFTPQLYIREGRRMIGEYVMTEHDCWGHTAIEDEIGMAAYTMDSHNIQRIVVDGMVKNEGNVEVGGFPPYPIAYRSITPKREECTNLLVPIALSASHISFGSIRMEPVFMVLGQSAAVAASMAIDGKVAVQKINSKALQLKLKTDPYLNGGVYDVLIDDQYADLMKTTGQWEEKHLFGRSYNASTLISKDNNAKVSVSVKVPKDGQYSVYFYCTPTGEMKEANNYLFTINHQGGDDLKQVSLVESQGDWEKIGEYEFKNGKEYSIELAAGKNTPQLIYDAILVVPTSL